MGLDNQAGMQGSAPLLPLPVDSLALGESVTVTTLFLNPARVSVGYQPTLIASSF